MTILVTGASGLIGRNLVGALVRAGQSVIAATRTPIDFESSLVVNLTLDFEKNLNFHSIKPPVEAIVHLAQSEKFRSFPSQAPAVFAANLQSTSALLDWAHRSGVRHFIYASSGGVYAQNPPFREIGSPLKSPGELNFYLASKLASEAFAQCYADEFSVAVMRFFFVYGRKQRREMLLPRIFDRVKRGEGIFLDGEEGFKLNPIHVSDAVHSIRASLSNPQSLLTNVAGPQTLSLRQVADIFASYLGEEPNYILTGRPPADVIGDTSWMSQSLFRASKTLGETVGDLED